MEINEFVRTLAFSTDDIRALSVRTAPRFGSTSIDDFEFDERCEMRCSGSSSVFPARASDGYCIT